MTTPHQSVVLKGDLRAVQSGVICFHPGRRGIVRQRRRSRYSWTVHLSSTPSPLPIPPPPSPSKCKHLNNTKAAQGKKKKKQQRDTMGFYSVMRSLDLGFFSLHSARPSWGTTGECVPVLRERNGKRAPKKCREWRTRVRRRRRSCFFHPLLVRTTGCTNQFPFVRSHEWILPSAPPL